MQKNGLIRKMKLTSKFTTSQPGKQTNNCNIHIHNISRSEGNQTMKLDQLKNIAWETFFLNSHTQNVVEKLEQCQVVKALNSQSRGPMFKTIGWLQG